MNTIERRLKAEKHQMRLERSIAEIQAKKQRYEALGESSLIAAEKLEETEAELRERLGALERHYSCLALI